MRLARLTFLLSGLAGAAISTLGGGCGQAFTSADGGGSDRRSPADGMTREGSLDAAPPDTGSSDSGPTDSGVRDARRDGSFCRGKSVNLGSDPRNCGVCGHDCGEGGVCDGGQCPVTTTVMNLTNPDGLAVAADDAVFFSELGDCPTSLCTSGKVSEHVSGVGTMPLAKNLMADPPGIPVTTDGVNVYWATSHQPGSVYFASVASPSLFTAITPQSLGSPVTASWVAMATDGVYVYAGSAGATIYYAPTSSLAAGSPKWTSVPDPMQTLIGIAAMNTTSVHYVFWANSSVVPFTMNTGSIDGTIVPTTGTFLPSLPNLNTPSGLSASILGAFWVDGTSVYELPLLAKSSTVLATPGMGLQPTRVVVNDKGALYWTNKVSGDPSGGTVMGMYTAADHPVPFTLATGQTNPTAIALGTSRVYWVNAGTFNGTDGAIMSTRR